MRPARLAFTQPPRHRVVCQPFRRLARYLAILRLTAVTISRAPSSRFDPQLAKRSALLARNDVARLAERFQRRARTFPVRRGPFKNRSPRHHARNDDHDSRVAGCVEKAKIVGDKRIDSRIDGRREVEGIERAQVRPR